MQHYQQQMTMMIVATALYKAEQEQTAYHLVNTVYHISFHSLLYLNLSNMINCYYRKESVFLTVTITSQALVFSAIFGARMWSNFVSDVSMQLTLSRIWRSQNN